MAGCLARSSWSEISGTVSVTSSLECNRVEGSVMFIDEKYRTKAGSQVLVGFFRGFLLPQEFDLTIRLIAIQVGKKFIFNFYIVCEPSSSPPHPLLY